MDYADYFYVIAGELNKVPKNQEGNLGLLGESFNTAVEGYISEYTCSYYKRLIELISNSELMIKMMQSPSTFWVNPNIVKGDYIKNYRELKRWTLVSLDDVKMFDIKEVLGKYLDVDALLKENHNVGFQLFGFSYMQNYLNLVRAFYEKVGEEAKYLCEVDDDAKALAYEVKDSFSLFWDIYNYLIRKVKKIREFETDRKDDNFIIELVRDIKLMQIIRGVFIKENDLANYFRYQDLLKAYPNIKYEEPEINRWLEEMYERNKGLVKC